MSFSHPNRSSDCGNMSLAASAQHLDCRWCVPSGSLGLFPMHLRYIWLQLAIWTRQAFISNGTSQEWERINKKTLCERGMVGAGIRGGLYNRFSSFMTWETEYLLREKSSGIYIFSLTSSQINLIIQQFNKDLLYIS